MLTSMRGVYASISYDTYITFHRFVIQSKIHKLVLKGLIAVNQVNLFNWNCEQWIAGIERCSVDFPHVWVLHFRMMKKLHK